MADQIWPRIRTLAERTLHYFGESRAEPNPNARPTVVWVTRDDDVRDCVEFWNLRALRAIGSTPMHLLPEDEIE